MNSDVGSVTPLGHRQSWASFARGLSVPGVLAGVGVPIVHFVRGRTLSPTVAHAFDLAMLTALFGGILAPLCSFMAIFVAIFTCMPTWAEAWRFRRTWRDVFLGVLGTIVAWACLVPEMLKD